MKISPEFALALACCRWSFSREDGSAIVRQSQGVDWRRFVNLARRHRVQGLVARALYENHVSPPTLFGDILSREAADIAERNLRSARESFRLRDAFATSDVALLFVKGLTLSTLAYGDPYVKMSVDVDVLIDAGALDRASAIFTQLGYRLVIPAIDPDSATLSRWHNVHKETLWSSGESDVAIDLHTALANNPSVIPAIGLSSPRQDVQIGRSRSLPTLATDDLFAYLCVHGSTSAWFRLKWITDLAALVHARSGDEIEHLYRHAVDRGAGRAPAQALLLADRLFGIPLSLRLRTQLASDRVNRFLVAVAIHELRQQREPTERPLGTAGLHLTQPLMGRGWAFKFGEVKRQIVGIVHARLLFGWNGNQTHQPPGILT